MTTDILLSKAIAGFLIARAADGYSPATLEQYKWGLKMLLDQGDLPLSKIDINHLRQFMATVQTGSLSSTSVFHIWKAIRAFYKWASAEGIADRPDKLLTQPRYASKQTQPFSQAEIKTLLKSTERTKPTEGKRKSFTMSRPTNLRDKAILLLLLDTGMRASELCRLTSQNVDLQNGNVTVVPYRSGIKSRSRTLPLGQASRKALWRYAATIELKKDDCFFGGINRGALTRLLVRLGERAGIENVHPHRFRHTFAVMFLRNGRDVFTLQRLLGHTSLEMVRHYLALAQVDDESAHRRASPVDNWKL